MATINSTNTPKLTTDGQLIIGKTGDVPQAATLTPGTNVTIVNGAGTITISAVNTPGPFTEVTIATQTIAVNERYLNNYSGGGTCTFTLPASASLGDTFEIMGKGSSSIVVAQNANQTIYTQTTNTTTGVGGSLTATERYDAIRCTCITAGASTDWVINGLTGNWTIV